jgi:membrane associated rhomboid family serine protease
MQALFSNLTTDQADTCGLILSATGISYRVKKGQKGWEIWVEASEHDTALANIKQYFKENRDIALPGDTHRPGFQKTYTGIWFPVVLCAWYLKYLSGPDRKSFIYAYGAASDAILNGELYRTVTALMLHADAVHLLGNMAGIAIFGTAVCGIMGRGLGWFMILLTGIFGNAINAAVLKTGHLSVGASTAIFGAIGILAGHQFLERFRLPGQRMKAWLPLAGGIALLGFLGSGAHTDLTAHLFGFISGLVLAIVNGVFFKHPLTGNGQNFFMALFVGVVAAAWVTGFSHG